MQSQPAYRVKKRLQGGCKRSANERQSQGGLTLEEYAEAKHLPVDFLRRIELSTIPNYCDQKALRIPYLDASCRAVAVRFRLSLVKSSDGDNRFRWRRGDKPCLYGLWRLKQARENGSVVLVEGESDAQTLWFYGIPALGIPGSNTWQEPWAEYLKGIPVIYVVLEPDSGGEAVRKWLAKSSIRDKVKLITLEGTKDPSELHVANPKGFLEAWQKAVDAAKPWTELEKAEIKARRKEAWQKCEALAREPNILERFAEAVTQAGLVGETRAAKLLYLACTSRFLERPVSVVVKGPSGGGKSFLVQKVLSFFPQSASYVLSSMSDKTLAFSKEPLSHRMLVLYEAVGLGQDWTSYFVRTLLSEGHVRYEFVDKSKGGLKARLIEREGPTGLITTTTAIRLDGELETRLFSVEITDTPEQTYRILMELNEDRNGMVDFAPWHALQKWLEVVEHRVTVPFWKALAQRISPAATRMRRDGGAILGLIKAHAILHHESRKRDKEGRVEATLNDFAAVRELVVDLISQGQGSSVSTVVRETVEAVKELLEAGADEVTVKQVAHQLGRDESTTWRRVKKALFGGYLENREMKPRRPARLVIGAHLPDDQPVLPPVEALRDCMGDCTPIAEGDANATTEGDSVSDCTIAPIAEGIPTPLPPKPDNWPEPWRSSFQGLVKHYLEKGMGEDEAKQLAERKLRDEHDGGNNGKGSKNA
ncbi:MAG: hypothetical protein JSV08_04600 [Acidobacteriota bacterium]|nr:MAG: hypothetical protein JSV08_04600 [Acidobacteriota bacterium]